MSAIKSAVIASRREARRRWRLASLSTRKGANESVNTLSVSVWARTPHADGVVRCHRKECDEAAFVYRGLAAATTTDLVKQLAIGESVNQASAVRLCGARNGRCRSSFSERRIEPFAVLFAPAGAAWRLAHSGWRWYPHDQQLRKADDASARSGGLSVVCCSGGDGTLVAAECDDAALEECATRNQCAGVRRAQSVIVHEQGGAE